VKSFQHGATGARGSGVARRRLPGRRPAGRRQTERGIPKHKQPGLDMLLVFPDSSLRLTARSAARQPLGGLLHSFDAPFLPF
jgi:hypothetical protein